MFCQKQVSRAGTSNYNPQILSDVLLALPLIPAPDTTLLRWDSNILINVPVIISLLNIGLENANQIWYSKQPILSYFIAVTSFERHGFSTHRLIDYLWNSLCRITTKKTSKVCIDGCNVRCFSMFFHVIRSKVIVVPHYAILHETNCTSTNPNTKTTSGDVRVVQCEASRLDYYVRMLTYNMHPIKRMQQI